MSSIYFGGSRHLGSLPILPAVVSAVVSAGHSVHVGCQFGADQAVLNYIRVHCPSLGHVFTVGSNLAAEQNHHVVHAVHCGVKVTYSAGGTSAPMPARFLLRSIAAFQGCAAAVFFQPGHGSLAVARECVRAGLPVYVFNPTPARHPIAPSAIPSVSGSWVRSLFMGRFLCWRWSAPSQPALF